ncbi:CopD family protein [Mycolicibacterium flavescens]|uniref:Copper resistance protein CopD n=1 Tax=Mycolicibacterium flavescens TaxID=1776 RepID=A0A1E3R7M5_MYCFV|nr:CopD family protein [Mycolicibacterium flavescens]ODQ85751.1 copper resistance protein CopD [Mycolicibacterium flavescens]
MNRRRAAAVGALVAAAATVLTWALAYPQGSLDTTAVRVLADCAAVLSLGLAAVPMLDGQRHRDELALRARAPLTVAAAVWVLAETARLFLTAAQTVAVRVDRLGLSTAVEFVTGTAAGRAGGLAVAAAAVVCVAAGAAPRSTATTVVAAGVAAVGVAARQLSGHLADSSLGGLAVTAHTLAAALWCGLLAALVLTVDHRGQWARILPRFSQLSLVCVVVLVTGGVVAAAGRLGAPAELFGTGYGRLLLAKVVMTAVLVGLGWRNRTMWVPAARTHRATAARSRTRSDVETGLMIVALALAAGLAVTG